jgi:hypothetical protein
MLLASSSKPAARQTSGARAPRSPQPIKVEPAPESSTPTVEVIRGAKRANEAVR